MGGGTKSGNAANFRVLFDQWGGDFNGPLFLASLVPLVHRTCENTAKNFRRASIDRAEMLERVDLCTIRRRVPGTRAAPVEALGPLAFRQPRQDAGDRVRTKKPFDKLSTDGGNFPPKVIGPLGRLQESHTELT
jgi:hypothetical protein